MHPKWGASGNARRQNRSRCSDIKQNCLSWYIELNNLKLHGHVWSGKPLKRHAQIFSKAWGRASFHAELYKYMSAFQEHKSDWQYTSFSHSIFSHLFNTCLPTPLGHCCLKEKLFFKLRASPVNSKAVTKIYWSLLTALGIGNRDFKTTKSIMLRGYESRPVILLFT